MTNKELKEFFKEKLLPHCEMALEKVKEKTTYIESLKLCESLFVQNGLCYCAYHQFREDIYRQPEINESEHLVLLFICVTPKDCSNKKQIIKSLQFRINFMKKIIQDDTRVSR